MTGIGIIAVGIALPSDVRTNDWWDSATQARWAADTRPAPPPALSSLSSNARQIAMAMAGQAPDLFQGTRKRHVIAADASSCDLETSAALDAITRAGVSKDAIDAVLTHTVTPEFLLTNSAAKVHARLGLKPECFALQVEAAAYAFLSQLELAAALIRAGRARYVLAVQSSAATRLVAPDSALAPIFGDAATAVLVGPVAGAGIIAANHFTDGRYPDTLVAGVPGLTWYGEGRNVIHMADPVGMRDVLLQTVDLCQSSVQALLANAGVAPSSIDFFCIHQGTAWLRAIAQEVCEMAGARSVETFAETGYIFGAIMPYALRVAEDRGLLAAGDRVLLFGGGTGMTYGATLVEWGRT